MFAELMNLYLRNKFILVSSDQHISSSTGGLPYLIALHVPVPPGKPTLLLFMSQFPQVNLVYCSLCHSSPR